MTTQNKQDGNCWDFFNCPPEKRDNCIIYQNNAGSQCWLIGGPPRPKIKREYKHCYECAWFKKLNPSFSLPDK